jgi:hypothetical protein
MAAKGIVQLLSVAAQNIDSYNKMFVDTSADVDNGTVFTKSALSTTAGEGQVYTIATPATGSLVNLWMACSPIDTITTLEDGNQVKLGLTDPRNFTNVQDIPFDGFIPQVGDKILLTAACLTGSKTGSTTHVIAADGSRKLTWNAGVAASAAAFEYLGDSYISIPDGSIGSQRVTAYVFECVAN